MRGLTYYPVNPADGTVHAFKYPERPSLTETRCGQSGEWVRSIFTIQEDHPICPTCYPEGF